MHYSKANPRRGARNKKKLQTKSGAPSKKKLATRSKSGTNEARTKRIKEECDFVALNSISTCRICLQSAEEGEEMASIFDQDADSVCLYEKIESCGGIKILTDPELPTRICTKCNGFLAIAHKFRLICRNSDNYLREFVCKYTSNQSNGDEHCDDVDDDNDHNETGEVMKSEFSNVATVGEVLQQAGHNVDETQHSIGYEEVAVVWMDEDENPVDLVAECHEEGSQQVPSRKPTPKHDKKQPAQQEKSGKKSDSKKRKKTDGGMRITSKTRIKETHICHICGNVYPRKWALDAHMKRHFYERPFVCEICSNAFHLNDQLVRHMRKHTGERPYRCQYCQRAFSDSSSMRKHERVHRNERPFKCDVCDKSFTYSNVLKRHKLTHTGEKPFVCGICGKAFACVYHMRSHLETIQHQNDPRSKLLLKISKGELDVGADGGSLEQNFKEAHE